MTTSPSLVIVVGAGASKEAGLPTGDQLKQEIANSLNFSSGKHSKDPGGGDSDVLQSLNLIANRQDPTYGILGDYQMAARTIVTAMPLAPSIDNFIDSRRQDLKIAQTGKIAIAHCILKAERSSHLYIDRSNTYNRLNFRPLANTWYVGLFQLLTQMCSIEEIEARFERVAIVSFNYDRCIKHFLREALIPYYGLQSDVADRIVSKLKILHPYGSIGPMPFESGQGALDFGEKVRALQIVKAAESLKTFTEGTSVESSRIDEIRQLISGARTLVYLGFAFHPLNMEMLYGNKHFVDRTNDRTVLGTAMGISESNVNAIGQELSHSGGYPENNIQLRRDLTAAGLIAEYSRHLEKTLRTRPI